MSWPTDSEWHPLTLKYYNMSFPTTECKWHLRFSLSMQSQHLSSYIQHDVSGTVFSHWGIHIMSHGIPDCECHLFVVVLFRSCPLKNWHWMFYFNLIPWPTGSEWHCIILPGLNLIPWQPDSEWHCLSFRFRSHSITNRLWVISPCSMEGGLIQISSHNKQGVSIITFLLFSRHSHSNIIPCPTACQYQCILLCQAVSFWPQTMTNRE